MVDKLDKETEKRLLEALAMLKEDAEKARVRQQVKLWAQEVQDTPTLMEVLSYLTKDELSGIRKSLALQGVSSLRKKELAEVLVHEIVQHAQHIFSALDEQQYKLIKKVCKDNGLCTNFKLDQESLFYLRNRGIMFTGNNGDKLALVVPKELVEKFKKLDNKQLQSIIKRNTLWIRLTCGLLYYYGSLNIGQIVGMLGKLTDTDIDENQLYTLLVENGVEGSYSLDMSDGVFIDYRVCDANSVIKEHKMRSELDYFPFTYEQFYEAGSEDYVEKNFAFQNLVEFIEDHYDIDREETEDIVEECISIINNGENFQEILTYLESCFEIPNIKMVERFAELVMYLHNNTRQWSLKGYTPTELSQTTRKGSNVVMLRRNESGMPVNNIQVGRNEPCPCGSGKKYKKCCGR